MMIVPYVAVAIASAGSHSGEAEAMKGSDGKLITTTTVL